MMKRVIFGLVLIGFFISTSYAQDLYFDSKQARDNYFEKEYQAKVKQLEKDKAELKSELKKKFDQQNKDFMANTLGRTNASYKGENGEELTRKEYLSFMKKQQKQVIEGIDSWKVERVEFIDVGTVTVPTSGSNDIVTIQKEHEAAMKIIKKKQAERQKEWNRKPFQQKGDGVNY